METAELAEVSRSIRSAMGDSAGQFRQAARENGANLEKIVKDLSKSFKAQNNQLADLTNSMEETAHEAQLTADRIDRLNSSIQESLTIQTNMLGELKNVSLNVKSLITTTSNLDTNLRNAMVGSGAGSLLGGITGKLGTVETALVTAIGSIALGAGAKTAYDYVSGGGGGPLTDSSVGKGGAEFQSVTPRLMQDLQRDFPGLTKEDAAAIIGNLGEESGGFTQMQEAGGSGPGRGWAQWTSADRKQRFLQNVQKHGGDLANYEANYETLKQELQGQYAGALKATMAAQGLQNKTQVFMEKFENPGVPHFDVRMRYAQRAVNVMGAAGAAETAATPVSQPSVTPGAPQQTTEAASAGASRVEKIGGEHGHGPISGAMHGDHNMTPDSAKQFLQARQGGGSGFVGVNAEKLDPSFAVKMAEAIQKAEAATGTKAVITEGYRPPEVQAQYYANYIQQPVPWEGKMYYPQQKGGIAARPGHSRHQRGLAVDLSDNAARDWLVAHAGELGLGRVPGDAPHFQGSGGGGEDTSAGATPMPTSSTPVTPSGATTATTPLNPAPSLMGMPSAQATPMMQPPVSPGVSSPLSGTGMGAMMGMMGGMMPGGMGGIVGTLAPMLISAISSMSAPSLEPMQPQQPSMQNIPEQDPIAELISSLSGSALNAQMVSQAAVQKQAQQEMPSQAIQSHEAKNTPGISSENISFSNPAPGYNYNMPWDTGWPDWLDALGGVNYSEMKSIKTSFR